jgi:predicted NACHT family NTPase
MQKADDLIRLMKQQTDALVASDEKLQQFLMWVNQKSLSVKVPYKPAAVRAFYFAFDRGLVRAFERGFNPALERGLVRALDPGLVPDLVPAHNFAVDRALAPALVPTLDRALIRTLAPAFESVLDSGLVRALNPELRQALQQLKEQLPKRDSDEVIFKQWWKANGQAWTRQLRDIMIFHRNIGHDWQFSKPQREVLQPYYEANKLLVDCLNSSSNALDYVLEPELKRSLKQLKKQLSDLNKHEKEYKQWWEANGQVWTQQLRAVMIKYCDIGHDWHFSEQEQELLQQYYEANKLLVNCLNSSCNVTPAVRSQIEETLLLPTEMLQNAEG